MDTIKIQNPIRILGTGIYQPRRQVTSEQLDQTQGFPHGHTYAQTGVDHRYYADDESASDMAVAALHEALDASQIRLDQLDCLIAGCGTMEQMVPYNAAIIHAKLNFPKPIPAFDVNMTCLSGLMALDLAYSLLGSGRYQTIAVVSSEVASVGVDLSDIKTGGIFGDGAAAIILTTNPNYQTGNQSLMLASLFETHSEGVELCQVKGGGTLNHPTKIIGDYVPYSLFQMRGKELYRLATNKIDGFIDRLLSQANLVLDDIDWLVPHQASHFALDHIQKKLQVPDAKFINILRTTGNQIAVSIPWAFHRLINEKPVKPGDRILLIGTAAGLSLGAVVLEWS